MDRKRELTNAMLATDPDQAKTWVTGHKFSRKELKMLKRSLKLLPQAIREEVEQIVKAKEQEATSQQEDNKN